MATTRVCKVVNVPADRLWAVLSEYGTWNSWNQRITESHIEGADSSFVPVGAVRAVGPRGMPRVRERLVSSDEVRRIISYEVAAEPKWQAPVRNYRATVKIIELTDEMGAVVEWSGAYDCNLADEDEMQDLLEKLYNSFVMWLAEAARNR